VRKVRILCLTLAGAIALCVTGLRGARTQVTSPRRVTKTSEEGINLNPSISGDGRMIAFESTRDIAAAGGTDHFRAIRANVAGDPATFLQMGGTRAVAPALSQDGSRLPRKTIRWGPTRTATQRSFSSMGQMRQS